MDSICLHPDPGCAQEAFRAAGFIAWAGLLGLAWRWHDTGVVVAPCLIVALRFATVLAYFLAGSSGLPAGAATLFGPGHGMSGDVLWITSAVLLVLPWVWASGWNRTLTALVLDAVPPLGCFGWLSPLAAAGALYLTTGLWGLALLVNLVFLGPGHRSSPPAAMCSYAHSCAAPGSTLLRKR